MENIKLGYIIYNESWYYNSLQTFIPEHFVYEIMVLINPESGGVDAEFPIRWYMLGGKSVPRIEMYGDCWRFLPQLQSLFADLAGLGMYATHESVVACLNTHAEDMTERTI